MKRMSITVAGILAVLLLLCGCGGQESEETGRDESTAEETKPAGSAEAGQDEAGIEETAADEPEKSEDIASISILGDSISTYQGCNPVGYYAFYPEYGEVKEAEDTWWRIVADDMDLEIYVNGSSSGATVAGDSDGTEDPQCACNELRTNDLAGPGGTCPDGIIVYLGSNDLLKAVPLGDNDGTSVVLGGEVASFSDAYTLMLDKLQANYPLAQIYCCTLLQVGDYGTQTPYVEFVNGADLTAADYGEVITRIAENRGFPVIDLYNCGVTIENLQEMTGDGLHPTAEGMKRIAEAVKEVLAGER